VPAQEDQVDVVGAGQFDGVGGEVGPRGQEDALDLVGRDGQLLVAGLDEEAVALLAQAGPEGVAEKLHGCHRSCRAADWMLVRPHPGFDLAGIIPLPGAEVQHGRSQRVPMQTAGPPRAYVRDPGRRLRDLNELTSCDTNWHF
jgi:hypothetical protein